jgi:hypothetical protein
MEDNCLGVIPLILIRSGCAKRHANACSLLHTHGSTTGGILRTLDQLSRIGNKLVDQMCYASLRENADPSKSTAESLRLQ